MQTRFVVTTSVKKALALALFFILFSCQKNNSKEEPSQFKNPGSYTPATPPYDLDVILRGEGKSIGYIMFRQDPDAAKIISLNVWVRHLEPNHDYLLQRAVDTNLDGNCTGTAWLTLGKGLEPQPITTDKKGNGDAALWRDVSTIPSGATFDIHFQVIDAVSMAVVLTSDCHQYTVR